MIFWEHSEPVHFLEAIVREGTGDAQDASTGPTPGNTGTAKDIETDGEARSVGRDHGILEHQRYPEDVLQESVLVHYVPLNRAKRAQPLENYLFVKDRMLFFI